MNSAPASSQLLYFAERGSGPPQPSRWRADVDSGSASAIIVNYV